VSARARPPLFIIGLIVAVWVLRAVVSDAQTDALHEWVTPQEALVLFNTRWPDEDGNYRSDSQDVAEYYAAQRGIPTEHLLGLPVTERTARLSRVSGLLPPRPGPDPPAAR
jgi:hypothetical protein